jgi:DNA-binding response OmpR family regulator
MRDMASRARLRGPTGRFILGRRSSPEDVFMTAPPAPRAASILLVHDDGHVLDELTRAFEARGFEVAIAATESKATSHLQAPRAVGAVVAGWHAGGGMGEAVYRWALTHRYDLRARFVFVETTPPERFDQVVQGRCLLVGPEDRDEILRIASALAESAEQEPDAGDVSPIDWGARGQPTLLLIEDDPLQMSWMKTLLGELGFRITSVESHQAALARLAAGDYELILGDWYMADGSGADLHAWLARNRPHLVSRCVFMSASLPGHHLRRLAPGCPVLPKGQDARSLVWHLRSIVEETRSAT